MKISIEYCMEWNYEPRARSLRDDLIKEFKGRFEEFAVEPIQSRGGVFRWEEIGLKNWLYILTFPLTVNIPYISRKKMKKNLDFLVIYS